MLLIILVIILIIVIKLYLNNNKIVKIKSDKSVPLLGHVLQFGKNNENFITTLENMWLKYGRDKFILKIGLFDQIVLTLPEDIETVLSGTKHINRSILYVPFKQSFGESIITHRKDKWQVVRKIISPAFNYNLLNYYNKILEEERNNFIKNFNFDQKEDVNVYPMLYKSLLRTTCRSILGFEIKCNDILEEYMRSIGTLLHLSTSRAISSWKLISPIYNLTLEGKQFKANSKIVRMINKQILEIKQKELKDIINRVNSGNENLDSLLEKEEYKNQIKSFVHLLLLGRYPNGIPFTTEEMINEINVFVTAGFETSTAATSFAMYNLALNPDVQDKAYQEQLILTGGNLDKEISYKEITEMKYLDLVIKETMRLYPPAIFLGREIDKGIVLSDGIELPGGANVLLMPFFTHRNPKFFPNPEKFDPNRFREKLTNQYAYFPFSAGPRNCVGQKLGMLQVKFFLATVLRSMELLPPLGQKPKLYIDPVLKSSTGINLRIRRRHAKSS